MQRYRLIFDGHLQPQASREEVQRQLADLFQVSPEQVETLFSKPPVVLKEDLDYDTALKDKASFEATGALCRLEAQSTTSRNTMWGAKRGAARQTDGEKTVRASGERQFDLRHPYTLAFFSPAFYADVAAHWRGLAFVHLLLVLLISAAVYMTHFRTLVSVFMAEEAPPIIAQIPEILIQNGNVRVDVVEPYTIYQPDSGKVFAVIDTTGEISSLRQTDAVLLLTGSRLSARLSSQRHPGAGFISDRIVTDQPDGRDAMAGGCPEMVSVHSFSFDAGLFVYLSKRSSAALWRYRNGVGVHASLPTAFRCRGQYRHYGHDPGAAHRCPVGAA
jgi:hypothetical protein